MAKSRDAFRTISEVADWLGIQAHVLRFWESKFSQIRPVKRAGGRRYYRPADMLLIGGIKKLLHDDGLTIKGVQKVLREQGVAHVSSFSPPLDEEAAATITAEAPAPSAEPEAPVTPDAAPPAPPPAAAPEVEEPKVIQLAESRPKPVQYDLGVEAPSQDQAWEDAATAVQPDPAASETPADPHGGAPVDAPKEARPRIVDAQDPPADTEIPAAPGPLSRLARTTALAPDHLPQAEAISAELKQLHERLRKIA
jgi:DNA-binding transcriptional MerR regulator